MKLNRTQSAARNIIVGSIQKIAAILLPFVVRTVMLHYMGTEYVGLDSLFTSILSFLSIAELGVGNALIYSMYKPIAMENSDEICALLNLYKKLYRIIGLIVLGVGLSLIPFLKYLVKGDCPDDVNFYILYLVYLLNSALSYIFMAYMQSLLMAHQRNDMISRCMLFAQASMYILQVGVLIFFRNYYLYIILLPVCTIAINLSTTLLAKKAYPQYFCKGKVSKEVEQSIKKKIAALFGSKISSVILHASDNIIISIFLGLTIVTQYGNYYYVMNAVIGLTTVLYSAFVAGVGNSLETESLEKNLNDFKMLSFLNYWITMFCACSLLCLYQPFIEVWAGEDLLFPFHIVILFAIYFYIYQSYRIVLTYKDAAGIWWEDRFRPYVIMIVNVIGNVILIQIIDVTGVVLSTIISLIISVPWATYTVYKYIFKTDMKQYSFNMLIHIFVAALCCALSYLICSYIPFAGYTALFVRLPVCIIVPNVLYFFIFRKSLEFRKCKNLILSILHRK